MEALQKTHAGRHSCRHEARHETLQIRHKFFTSVQMLLLLYLFWFPSVSSNFAEEFLLMVEMMITGHNHHHIMLKVIF